jgi:hypothetical protein
MFEGIELLVEPRAARCGGRTQLGDCTKAQRASAWLFEIDDAVGDDKRVDGIAIVVTAEIVNNVESPGAA